MELHDGAHYNRGGGKKVKIRVSMTQTTHPEPRLSTLLRMVNSLPITNLPTYYSRRDLLLAPHLRQARMATALLRYRETNLRAAQRGQRGIDVYTRRSIF